MGDCQQTMMKFKRIISLIALIVVPKPSIESQSIDSSTIMSEAIGYQMKFGTIWKSPGWVTNTNGCVILVITDGIERNWYNSLCSKIID